MQNNSNFTNGMTSANMGEHNSSRFSNAARSFDIEDRLNDLRLRNEETYLNIASKNINKLERLKLEAEQQYLNRRLSSISEVEQEYLKRLNKRADAELDIMTETNKKIAKAGLFEDQQKRNAALKAVADEYKTAIKNQKNLTKTQRDDLKKIAKERIAKIHEEYKELEKKEKKFRKIVEKDKARERTAAARQEYAQNKQKYGTVGAITRSFKDDDGSLNLNKGLSVLTATLSDYAKKLEGTIDQIGSYKGKIDTRLYGSKNKTKGGSYWDELEYNVTGVAGLSPLVKQRDIITNINEMVNKGIAFNVEQRAFLATIKDKIATTFNAFDSNLLKLIRIQQQDSTAARLGMESALTAFLNNMYETTEYLSDVASTVRSSLLEAESLMTVGGATSFEYQVQKWLGSLYSVGMSDSTVSSIANVLGQFASGDISNIGSGGASNLLIMAANNANLSLSDMLAKGLDESATNSLLTAMVEYMQKMYSQTQDNLVVQQQMAKVYGLRASDLRAAWNLTGSTKNINTNFVNYNTAMQQLTTMAGSMYSRSSIGELMGNAFDNFNYTLAGGIANSPALYAIYKTANLLDSLVNGIEFSVPMVFGTGSPQTYKVSDIMKTGVLGASLFKGIGSMLAAGSGFGLSGNSMLNALEITSGIATVKRGAGENLLTEKNSTSGSGYFVASGGGDDVPKNTIDGATKDVNKTTASAADTSDQAYPRLIHDNVVNIYTILKSLVDGSANIHVKVDDYGLTGWN